MLTTNFWSEQFSSAFSAWAIFLLLFVVAVAFRLRTAASTRKKIRELDAYTEVVEYRLQLAQELSSEEVVTVASLQAQIDALRQLVQAKPKPWTRQERKEVKRALEEVEARATALSVANSKTEHILTAENLAVSDYNEKRTLRLVPRPRFIDSESERCGADRLMDNDWVDDLEPYQAMAALDVLKAKKASITPREAVEILKLKRALEAKAGETSRVHRR